MSDKYPEHEKLQKVRPQSQILGEFLDWCSETGVSFERNPATSFPGETVALYVRPDDLLHQYFGISAKVLEQEKRAMIQELRAVPVTL